MLHSPLNKCSPTIPINRPTEGCRIPRPSAYCGRIFLAKATGNGEDREIQMCRSVKMGWGGERNRKEKGDKGTGIHRRSIAERRTEGARGTARVGCDRVNIVTHIAVGGPEATAIILRDYLWLLPNII